MLICSPDSLAAFLTRARGATCVALDTEFVWERTYYPRLGIVQAALPDGECVLIDPLAIEDLSPLGGLLSDRSVVKVLHDAHQDLVILSRATSRPPVNVFDTRTAAGFAGMSCTVSLQKLVRDTLGVRLAKTQTRTDWLRRPLSEQQVTYALDDVRYMIAVYEHLVDRAQQLDHETWLREEMRIYDDASLYEERNPLEQFARVKGAGRLSSRKLSVLRELAAWREREARSRDVPREHVAPDVALMALAQHAPGTPESLARLGDIPRSLARRNGSELAKAVRRGLSVPPKLRPQPAHRSRKGRNVKPRVDKVLAWIAKRCEQEGIDQHLATTRAEVAALAHECRAPSPDNHRLLRGWRYAFLGKEVAARLAVDA
jgi:ribonuclease D